MKFKYTLLILLTFIFYKTSLGQSKFKVKIEETDTWKKKYSLIDEEGKTIKKLDSSKYKLFFYENSYKYFTVFGIKGLTGFQAINENEEILFEIYNTYKYEISPDVLRENKIRIIDRNRKIGFANHKGKIIIEPQFENVSSFHNNKAIISKQCKEIHLNNEKKHDGIECHHSITKCQEHGYINELGEIIKIGNYTFKEIAEEINWKPQN